jgi:hypothetical protein
MFSHRRTSTRSMRSPVLPRFARALSLPDAFAHIMALAGYEQWVFTRTARIIHLVMLPGLPDAPFREHRCREPPGAQRDHSPGLRPQPGSVQRDTR